MWGSRLPTWMVVVLMVCSVNAGAKRTKLMVVVLMVEERDEEFFNFLKNIRLN